MGEHGKEAGVHQHVHPEWVEKVLEEPAVDSGEASEPRHGKQDPQNPEKQDRALTSHCCFAGLFIERRWHRPGTGAEG